MPLFTPRSSRMTREAVRAVRHKPRSFVRPRRQTYPTTGGKANCDEVDELYIEGVPSSGNALVTYTLDHDPDDMDAPVSFEIEIPYNSTTSTLDAALLTHPEIAALDPLVPYYLIGGPWPNVALYIIWRAPFGSVEFPLVDSSDLNNGAAVKMRKASAQNWRGFA